jgi:gentisate 1,2-dioxygenase
VLSRDQDPDSCHGWKMQYVNPLTGGHAMPTIAAFIQLLPKDYCTQTYRCTDGTIYSVVEGKGSVTIAGERFAFEPRDTFVVPSWHPLQMETTAETVLFSFSDRPGQEVMGLWREKRG